MEPLSRQDYSEGRADWIIEHAPMHFLRTGQLLINNLPREVANVVRGTKFDPFYQELTREQIINWFDDHIIFSEDDQIIVVFDNDKILWERE